jgi:hypothetical protein
VFELFKVICDDITEQFVVDATSGQGISCPTKGGQTVRIHKLEIIRTLNVLLRINYLLDFVHRPDEI